MNLDNRVYLLVAVAFYMSPQLGGIGTKYQDLVVYFCLGEGETLPQFHPRALQTRSEMFLFNDEAGQTNNLIGKYIMCNT